jgi:hypothetical protein
LAKVLALLRRQNGGGEPAPVADTEGDTLVAAFNSHLQHVAGLLPGTRSHCLRHATLFLKAVFSAAPFDVPMVTPQAITKVAPIVKTIFAANKLWISGVLSLIPDTPVAAE